MEYVDEMRAKGLLFLANRLERLETLLLDAFADAGYILPNDQDHLYRFVYVFGASSGSVIPGDHTLRRFGFDDGEASLVHQACLEWSDDQRIRDAVTRATSSRSMSLPSRTFCPAGRWPHTPSWMLRGDKVIAFKKACNRFQEGVAR